MRKRRLYLPLEAVLLFIPISFASVYFVDPGMLRQPRLVEVTLISIAATVTFILSYFLFLSMGRLLRRKTESIELLRFVGFFAFLGVIRAIVIVEGFDYFSLPLSRSLVDVVVSSSFTSVLWMALLSLVVSSYKSFSDRYRNILQDAIVHRALDRKDGVHPPAPGISSEIEELELYLRRVCDDLVTRTLGKESLLQAAKEVRYLLEEKIRPLSHRLWKTSLGPRLQLRISRALLLTLDDPRPTSLPVACFVSGAIFVQVTLNRGLLRGIFSGVVSFGLVAMTPWFMKLRRRDLRSPILTRMMNIFFLALPGVLVAAAFAVANAYLFEESQEWIVLLFAAFCFTAVFLDSFRVLVGENQEALLARMKSELNSRHSDDVTNSHRFASYLHNSLQSELFALSKQLESAAEEPESPGAKAMVERAHSTLSRSLSQGFHDSLRSPRDQLLKVRDSWRGLVAVTVDPDTLPGRDLEFDGHIVQVIEEEISNAYRHGSASTISVEMVEASGEFHVFIRSDGNFDEVSSPGMGHAWLESHALSWSRTREPKGSALSIRFSLP